MKKILLFALSLGMGSFAFAQTSISVNSILQPTGTVYMGAGDPQTTIEVNMTNNTTSNYAAGSGMACKVSLDGVAVADPAGQGWVQVTANSFDAGTSRDVTLTAQWSAQGDPGNKSLCVELTNLIEGFTPHTNNDPNKEACADFDFDYPASVDNVTPTEISQIISDGDVLTVYIKNVNANPQINIMSITGQVVKTVTSSISGNNIYEEINVSDVAPGLYIVTVQSENGAATAKKVFIQ